MFKTITQILLIFCIHSIAWGEDTPEADLRKAKLLCEKKIKEANQELLKAKKARNKEIKFAIKEYDSALEQVKINYTKKEELEKALSYKDLQEELRRQSILEYITTAPVKKSQPDKITPPEKIDDDPLEIDNSPKEVVNKPDDNRDNEDIVAISNILESSNKNTVSSIKNTVPSNGTVNNLESSANTGTNTNISLGNVLKDLSHNEQSLQQHGFSVNGSCITGPQLEGDETPFISNTTYKFNGKCEYCFKIKGRWYHGALLKIGDKIYYMSFGHWANGGTRIVTNGQLESTNRGAKIIACDKEETKLKGKEYKVNKYSKEWNEVKIVIDKGSISYLYNGNEIHKESVDIPRDGQLQFGFSTYRCETELKDFSLKLN